jgi:hypothetical protein
MEGIHDCADRLIVIAAKALTGHKRRLFIAAVTLTLCDGNARASQTFAARQHYSSPANLWAKTQPSDTT